MAEEEGGREEKGEVTKAQQKEKLIAAGWTSHEFDGHGSEHWTHPAEEFTYTRSGALQRQQTRGDKKAEYVRR